MPHSGLIVRRTERFEISLPARVRVAAKHQEIVQFAKGVADADRWISVDVVDFAQGGIGFVSDIFFARALELEIEISNPADPGLDVWVCCEMSIKRVQMTDRRPAYLMGGAFIGLDEGQQTAIDTMVDRLLGKSNSGQNNGGGHA